MLNRGLSEAWLVNDDGVALTFYIEPSQIPGKKQILVVFPNTTEGHQAPKVIADKLEYDYAIGCVNRMLELYAAGTDLMPGGLYDNNSQVWGVNL